MQIAIDGPAGSGKSTVCKMIADKYGFTYLDTGAMYRAAAWLSLKFPDYDLCALLEKTEFRFRGNGKILELILDGNLYDVTEEIRTPPVSDNVSSVAAIPQVRAILTKKQREYSSFCDIIMEGRDTTTVVLPNADIKIFLTANDEERAKRRFDELKDKSSINYEEVLENIKKRDKIDSSRECAPLKKASDAELIDTTGLSLQQVVERIGSIIENKRNKS